MICLKNYIRLLLFFLVVLVESLFIHNKVLAKEIKYEMRGASLSLDQVSFDSDFNLDKFKIYITNSYDELIEQGFNTVFVDISKFIDLKITEKFNDEYKNALRLIVKEGFNRALEIHGSFSDFSLKGIEGNNLEKYLASLNEKCFIKDKIDWIVRFNDKYYLDPGVHEIRDYFIDTIVDIGTNYKFDGIYLDKLIYPDNINKYTFNDSNSFNTYNEDNLYKDDWRRQNLNDFIKVLGQKFKSYRNELKFGVGVNYIWRSFGDDLNGINYEGYSDYDNGAFDSLNIGKMGYVNYIVVKIDKKLGSKEDIRNIISWWERKFRTYLVDIFIQGDDDISSIIDETRENYFINGFLYTGGGVSENVKSKLSTKAIVPRFKSFDSYYTITDLSISPKLYSSKIEFNVLDNGYENTKNLVVYKFPYSDIDPSNGEYIKGIFDSKGESTKITLDKEDGVYAITKLNYNSIESKILSSFIMSDKFGLIEGRVDTPPPNIVNNKIELLIKSHNKDNKFRFILEKDGEYINSNDFDNYTSYSFTPTEKGLYKLSVLIFDKNNEDDNIISYYNFDIKDKYTVVLDAGHGGDEIGAKSMGKIFEKDINLAICNYTRDLLKQVRGIDVRRTRINDIKIDLSDRVKICSFLGGDVFLSIHQNAFDNEGANGVETYHYLKEELSKRLSDLIQVNLINHTSAFDRGVKTSNFVVLRENIIPSTLIECGFITNQDERNNLIDESYQRAISEAIYRGILSYLDIESV